MQRILNGPRASPIGSRSSIIVASRALLAPKLPGRFALAPHTIEFDLVLQCVHRLPEAVVSLRPEQPLLGELLAALDMVEDRAPEYEVAAVDPMISQLRGAQVRDGARRRRLHVVI